MQIKLAGHTNNPIGPHLHMANRHGLIAGATGTGKTVTLQVLAEQFSQFGVPVFMADVKGDLSGLARPGSPNEKIRKRVEHMGLESQYANQGFPVVFWDLFGQLGHPMRTTISDLGPLLLTELLGLTETQSAVLIAAFQFADDEGLLLLDLKDLRALLSWVSDHRTDLRAKYGELPSNSIGAIQRRLLVLEQQGGEQFVGEPVVSLHDLMQTDLSGQGVINILDATKLMASPKIYAMFLLWLISELFEQLPEVGDADKPKMVFFFDEAHLLFDDANKTLIEKIELVVRLIRSKGVGIYFVTQNPLDIPDSILGQLGNRIQHALRAFTPKDQKAVRVVAQTFRQNEDLNTEEVIGELATGEALISCLDSQGSPIPVERVLIHPPRSQIGPLVQTERDIQISRSPYQTRYQQSIDRESAYELLQARALKSMSEDKAATPKQSGRPKQSVWEAFAKSTLRSIGSQLGRQIVRGILGSIFGKKR